MGKDNMNKIPEDIARDIDRACALHERTTSDHEKCLEFNRLMGDILARLEDAGLHREAGRVMTILLNCNPKEGTSCEKTSMVGEKVKKIRGQA